MNYLIEAIFVGGYSAIIRTILVLLFNPSLYTLFFITGFFKHFIGNLSGIHNYYCKYVCKRNDTAIYTVTMQSTQLFIESILEGIAFLSFGIVINRYFKHTIINVFLTGVLLHIISEIIGLHEIFCKMNCSKKKI